MAHNIYQTDGIILDRYNFGESEKLYIIFTEKLGKINAVGQGVRNLKSKLKNNLEPLCITKLAVVATGDSWRLTDADKLISFWGVKEDEKKLAVYAKLTVFLGRMLQGQEKNQNLWEQVKADLLFLEEENFNEKELSMLETAFVARSLHNLGYIDKNDFPLFIEEPQLNKKILSEMENVKRAVVFAVNGAIKASHL